MRNGHDRHMDVSINLHVRDTTRMGVQSSENYGGGDWLLLGPAALFFKDDADVSRLIRDLEILRYRMRRRAELPEDAADPVAASLDSEQEAVEVGRG